MLFNAVLVVCGLVLVAIDETGTANIKVTQLKNCDPAVDYPLQIKATFKDDLDNVQLVTTTGDFRVPFGEDSDFGASIEIKTSNDMNYAPLFEIYDNNTCEAAKKFLGDIIFEIQKMAGIEVGSCPIPKGSYGVADYPLDFKKLPLQSFPEGTIRSKCTIKNIKTDEVLMCLVSELKIGS